MLLKKIVNIALNILLYTFLALCIFSVFFTVFAKRDSDGAAEIFGYQMRVVTTESMEKSDATDVSGFKIKSIPKNSMVFIDLLPDDAEDEDEWYRDLKVGDVLTFRYVYSSQITITHRITSITEKDSGGFIIELAGDNKSSDSEQLYQMIDTSVPNSTNYVIGKVTGQSLLLGAIMTVLKSTLGILLLVILPCLVIMCVEVIKIIKALNAQKREDERIKAEEKDNELLELRRKVAELEAEKDAQKSADEHPSDTTADSEVSAE